MRNITARTEKPDIELIDGLLDGTGYNHRTKACMYYYRHGEDGGIVKMIRDAINACYPLQSGDDIFYVKIAHPDAFMMYILNLYLNGSRVSGVYVDICLLAGAIGSPISPIKHSEHCRNALRKLYDHMRPATTYRWNVAYNRLISHKNEPDQRLTDQIRQLAMGI